MSKQFICEQYENVVRNQLDMKDPQSTYDTYHQLLENGFEEEQAIQLLTYAVGVQIGSILADQQPFDETHWNEMMGLLSKEIPEKGERISDYQLTKKRIRAKKEVGIFQDDQIDEYLDQLYVIDMVLYQFNSIFKLSGREILKMLEIEIVRQYAYLHQQSFNFEDCVDEIMIYLSKSLGQSFYDQYPDVEIETYIQCLNKVYSSVEFWTKEWGNDGYIEYIKEFIV